MTKAEKKEYQRRWHLKNYKAKKRGRNDGRSSNPEHINKSNLAWSKRNPERRLLSSAKQRAKTKGIDFDLVLEDIVIPEYCPISGVKLVQGYEDTNTSPSLDRIDNTLGYIRGNIHVISNRMNIVKRDASLVELKQLVKYLEKL